MRVSTPLLLREVATPPAPPSGSRLLYVKTDGKVYTHSVDGKVTPQATEGYVQSRGMNLITNGSGLLGDNTNFSTFDFITTDAPTGAGAFQVLPGGVTRFSDEYIPVDPAKTYTLMMSAKALGSSTTSRMYAGLNVLDADGNNINANHHMYMPNTLTTLAQDLDPGDTEIHLTSAANWVNTTGSNIWQNGIIFWDYASTGGRVFPESTYSRNVYSSLWGAGDIVGNVITLDAPWAGPTKPAGTKLSNANSGGAYKYVAASNLVVPQAWTVFSGEIGGIDTTGTNLVKNFPPGTAFVQLMWLVNRNSPFTSGGDPNGQQAFGGIWFSEVASANLLDGTITDAKIAAANKDGATATPSMRTLGTGATQAAAGVHTHHVNDLSATGTKSASTYLRGDNTWFNLSNPSQAEAEAGTATSLRLWTAQRINQAIQALSPVKSVAGRIGAVVLGKADVGLGSVDNTSDANKPVSTAQQIALNAKANAVGLALNARDYGAVGDGVADDTAALNAWLDAQAASGRGGYLPAGVYRVTASLNRRDTTARFSIHGDGARLSFLYGDFIGAGQGIIDLSDVNRNSGFHRLTGIGFLGNNAPGDPIGVLLEHSWSNILEDISAPNIDGKVLCNSLIFATKDNNSKYRNIHSQGGWQPRAFAQDTTARASFTSGSTTITSTIGVFTTAMVGSPIFFAGGSNTGSHSLWWATIVSRISSTQVTIDVPAPTTDSDIKFRVGRITGSINAGSNQLTLQNVEGLSANYVGMSVHVLGGANKSLGADNPAVLSTRITAVSGNTLTLEATAKNTVTNQVIMFAPPVFVGDLEEDPSSLETNHSWWSDVHLEGFPGVGLIVNSAQYVVFDRLKLHGASYFAASDWGECQFGAMISDAESLTIRDVQCNYGVGGAKIHISASWGAMVLENVEFGHLLPDVSPIRVQNPDDCFRLLLGKVHTFALTNFSPTWTLVNAGNFQHVVEMFGTFHTQDMIGRYTPGAPSPVNAGVTAVHEAVAVSNLSTFAWSPPGKWGILHVACSSAGVHAMLHYRLSTHSAGVDVATIGVGSNVDVLTTATTLTGTTGTHTRVTIACDSNGRIQVENRRGFGIRVALYHTAYGE